MICTVLKSATVLCRDVFIFSAVGSTSLPNSQIKKNGIHNADNTFPYNIGACPTSGRTCCYPHDAIAG